MDLMLRYLAVLLIVVLSVRNSYGQGTNTQFTAAPSTVKAVSCVFVAGSTTANYDTITIYRDLPSVNTFDSTSSTIVKIVEYTDGNNPVSPAGYVFTPIFASKVFALTILSVSTSDHGNYFCRLSDIVGSTSQPTLDEMFSLNVYVPDQPITMTAQVNGMNTGVVTGPNDPITDTDVVATISATFICEAKDGYPATTLQWQINDITVSNGGGILITQVGPDPNSIHLVNTTSTLTFTPQLVANTGVVASDDSRITCVAIQDTLNGITVSADTTDSTQRLNVLVHPAQPQLSFIYGGTTYSDGGTIMIVRGQRAVITAKVTATREASNITFDTSNITPYTNPSEGDPSYVTSPGVDSRLSDTTRSFEFDVDTDNLGDTLSFTANNAAQTLTGLAAPTATVTFMVLNGPDVSLTYPNPVTGDVISPAINSTSTQGTCTSTIKIIEGTPLTITCTTNDTSPAAEIKVFLGDGGTDLTNDGTALGTSDNSHVTASGSLFNTVYTYTFTTHTFTNDNGKVVSCEARNTINGAQQVSIASACLEFLVPPSDIVMYVGLGGTNPVGATFTGELGAELQFHCTAHNANPAAGVFWRLPSRGAGDLTELNENPTQASDMLYDTDSILNNNIYSYTAGDCNQVLTCNTTHPESGNTVVRTDSTTLQVVVPPTSVTLELVPSSNNPASESPGTNILTGVTNVSDATLCVLHGKNYQFRATTNGDDPASVFAFERQSSAGAVENTLKPAGTASSVVTCSQGSSTDTYTLNNVDIAVYDGKKVCATADNIHTNGAVERCVDLDVIAEVKTTNNNMEMIVYRNNVVVNPVGNEYTLINGGDYRVDCRVRRAKPAPTSSTMNIALNGDLGGTTINPDSTDVTTGAYDSLLTTGRVTFTADHGTQCNQSMICTAGNKANTLLGQSSQTVSRQVKVVNPPSTPTLVVNETTNVDRDGDASDGKALLIEFLEYNFDCTVAADPDASIRWELFDGNNNRIHMDEIASTEATPDCNAPDRTHQYNLTAARVTFASLQCGYLQCTAFTSAFPAGNSSAIRFQIIKLPDQSGPGGNGIELRYRGSSSSPWSSALTHNQNLNLDVSTNYEFQCTVLNISPGGGQATGACPAVATLADVPGITRDIVNINFYYETDPVNDGTLLNAENATLDASDQLYDMVDTYSRTILAGDNCPAAFICSATVDAAGSPTASPVASTNSFPFIQVNITRKVLLTTPPTLVVAPTGANDVDRDGDPSDDKALLVENQEYHFGCTLPADSADPEASIRWQLYDGNGAEIHTKTDASPETNADCNAPANTENYTLTAARVKFASLQCGYLKCTAFTADNTTGISDSIRFQIIKLPPASPSGGGGSGIQLRYRETGSAWTGASALTHDQNINLDVGKDYEFECKLLNISPVGDQPAGACPVLGTLPIVAGVQRDTVNINFYYDNDAVNAGTSNDGETSVLDTNDNLYDVSDTWTRQIAAGDNCPADLTCRVVIGATNPLPAASNTDSPHFTIHITRVSPTIAVDIIPPTFGASVLGEEVDANNLALYDTEVYTLTCVPKGADPLTGVIWWLVNSCANSANDGTNGAQQLRNAFNPTQANADCTPQNTPANVAGEYDVWTTFQASFNSHNGKCLRCISEDGLHSDQYTLQIRKAPSQIRVFDGPTDDDNDGLIGTADELGPTAPVCNNGAFDFMAVAYGANPGVNPFRIRLGTQTIAANAPYSGITVDNVLPADIVDTGNGLFDSTARVRFPANTLTLVDNEKVVEICDPQSDVCKNVTLAVVDAPDTPLEMTVTDPFAAARTPQPAPTTRTLADGLNPVRLHLNQGYTFACNAKQARPYAMLDFSLSPSVVTDPLTPGRTSASPDPNNPSIITPQTLFDSTNSILFRPTNFESTGGTFCCEAENTATEIKCVPNEIKHCVKLEIIDKPSEIKMEFKPVDSSSGGFTPVVENGAVHTDLTMGDQFEFRCTTLEAAPAANVTWSFTPSATVNPSFNVLDGVTIDNAAPVSSGSSSLPNRYDRSSSVRFTAVMNVLGGSLKCCAVHYAFAGGPGGPYDDNPALQPICAETVLRFPVPADSVQIWRQLVDGGQAKIFAQGEKVEANVGEELNLNCTSYRSRPITYIGWSATNSNPALESSFIASDCPRTNKTSDPSNANELTRTYDTTKCVKLHPEESDHERKVYCTATNVADTVGKSTYIELFLCIPCSQNLKLLSISSNRQTIDYPNGDTVSFQRTGEGSTQTLSCVNSGARGKPDANNQPTKPVIDVYLQEPGSSTEIQLTSANANITLTERELSEGLFEVRKDVILTLGGSFKLDGAVLTCKCISTICGSGGNSEHTIKVNLTAFDQLPTNERVFLGTGPPNNLVDIDGGRNVEGAEVVITVNQPLTGNEPDPYAPPNFQAPINRIDSLRRKRQTQAQTSQMTCSAQGTKPAVNFIWKLDDQVLSGDFINTYSVDSVLNQGPGQGLLDTFSTFTLDPVYRGYHSRQLCCELSSSIIGSPIRRCADLIVLSGPNSPLEVSGTNVVNEGQTVQLQCAAVEHYPSGVFQWGNDGSALLKDEVEVTAPLQELSNFRLRQSSQYSFTASREDNGKSLTCKLEQNVDSNGIQFNDVTTGKIDISVNFCPTTNAQVTGCPTAPVAPGRALTISCQSAVSNPAVRLDWYMNNVEQSPSGTSTTQARDYGYVTIQSFTTRELTLADDGLQLQCCPTHLTPNIGCGQLCTSVCTVSVEQPPPDVGCRWVRLEMTIEKINGNTATWNSDYENKLSTAYRDLTNGLADVFRQVLDGLANYKSAIIPTLRQSADGHIQIVVGVEFDSPYGSTTDHMRAALADATNNDGYIVTDGGAVSIYGIMPNSVTAVCVCPSGYCARGPECRPSTEDFSSSCECPTGYSPPRCDVYVSPGPGTQPPTDVGVQYTRLSFILAEINDVAAIWRDDYNDVTDPQTQDLIGGLDSVLTGIFRPAFSNCFQNVRIADFFSAAGGGIGVVSGVEFTGNDCGVSVEDVRDKFFENVDSDQKIANSIYELDNDFLQETNVEAICGNDFSCSNGGSCEPSDTVYYSSCVCQPGYGGSRCQDIIRVETTTQPGGTQGPGDGGGGLGLSTEALIGIIIGVVLFAAIMLGLCLLCCFLCGDRERVKTRYVYTDEEEPPRRGYTTPPKDEFGSFPQRGRGKPYDDWPWSSDGRPPVAYNRDTFELNFDGRGGRNLGPRPVL